MNTKLLKAKLVALDHNVEWLANSMGISTSQLYRKLQNPDDSFSIKDVMNIRDILELTDEETTTIFFSQEVA